MLQQKCKNKMFAMKCMKTTGKLTLFVRAIFITVFASAIRGRLCTIGDDRHVARGHRALGAEAGKVFGLVVRFKDLKSGFTAFFQHFQCIDFVVEHERAICCGLMGEKIAKNRTIFLFFLFAASIPSCIYYTVELEGIKSRAMCSR